MLGKVRIWDLVKDGRGQGEMGGWGDGEMGRLGGGDKLFLLFIDNRSLICKHSLHGGVEKFATSVKNKNESC